MANLEPPSNTSHHIAVIDPAMRVPELDCFNRIAQESRCWTTYHLPALYGLDSLQQLSESRFHGIVILGSGASVYDGLPWQDPLHAWVYDQACKGVPTIGLCYGHQLLAHIFGGVIEHLWNGEKKRGTRPVTVYDPTLMAVERTAPLVISHREGITVCPKGFSVCAHSADVTIDGIAHSRLPIWGFQPHIEATAGL